MGELVLFILGSALICFLLCLYFLPALIAWYYNDKNTIWIFVLTLITGWTSLGWILALLWAVLERDGSDLIEKIREKMYQENAKKRIS